MVASLFRRSRAVSLRRVAGASRASRSDYGDEAHALSKVAGPAVAERVLYHAGYLGFIWVLARLGDEAMAANQSLISVESICFMSADGFGIAAAALVAQKLGAGEPRQATRAARIAARYAIVLLTGLGLLFLATRSFSLPLFSRDAEVIRARIGGGSGARGRAAVHGDRDGARAVAPWSGEDARRARRERDRRVRRAYRVHVAVRDHVRLRPHGRLDGIDVRLDGEECAARVAREASVRRRGGAVTERATAPARALRARRRAGERPPNPPEPERREHHADPDEHLRG